MTTGATTPGSPYARSELREMANGVEAAWKPSQGATMTATLAVNKQPGRFDGSAAKLVIGQIHGKSSELLRIYYDNKTVYFVNNHAGANDRVTTFRLYDENNETPNIDLGEKFSYKVDVNAKTMTVTVWADGHAYTASTAVNAIWQNDSLYFKAGVYLGANEITSAGVGEVAFYGLDYSHAPGQGLGGLKDIALPDTGVNLTGQSASDTLTGGDHADAMYGNGGDDNLNANGGDDRIYGGDGNDRMVGGSGADFMDGGNGNDTYSVDNANDVIVESNAAGPGGIDLVESSVSYTLSANVDNLVLLGKGNLNATGNASANTITGTDGNNVIDGGGGRDIMQGLDGNDTYYVDAYSDRVVEKAGDGKDLIITSTSYVLPEEIEAVTLVGAANTVIGNVLNNTMIGNDLANTLYGMDGDDRIDGGAGIDRLVGGNGNDTYTVDNTGDKVVEDANGGHDLVNASASYTLRDNVEDLDLIGTNAISGTGNSLDNLILGNVGANLINGGLGNDTLTGGGDGDTFAFNTPLDAKLNVDLITDFRSKADKIALDHLTFGELHTGSLDAKALAFGDHATTADQHVIYDQATGMLFYDKDGVGGADQVQFAQLSHGATLAVYDFIVT